jgi:hypothetical protein
LTAGTVDLRAALLALAFGDIDALGLDTILRRSCEESFSEFDNQDLLDLACVEFPRARRPWSRFDLEKIVQMCGGDALKLLRAVLDEQIAGAAEEWHTTFPITLFRTRQHELGRSVPFDIADPHLHSGASLPLNLFLGGVASRASPLAGDELIGMSFRAKSGQGWSVRALFLATRFGLRLLRYLADGHSLADHRLLEDKNFDLSLVADVKNGQFWALMRKWATSRANDDSEELLVEDDLDLRTNRRFDDDGLCDIGRVFRHGFDELPGEYRGFLIGLVRACVGMAAFVAARPGDGLSQFVHRFELMGRTRDSSFGELKEKAILWTLREMLTDHVVGAEFRKTITGKSPKAFRREVMDSLAAHHHAFASHVEHTGSALALSMPVGFLRRPWGGPGSAWTEYGQLKDAHAGYEGLRTLLRRADGDKLVRAISAIDVAGDEYGSSTWPYSIAAELLRGEGLDLVYTAHAGESFYSPLNGLRRVGELLLGGRKPDRIGHALALSGPATDAVCAHSSPPRRIGDLIQDVAWVGCLDSEFGDAARSVLYDLAKGPAGKSLPPDAWIHAYRSLWSAASLIERCVLMKSADGVVVCDLEEIEKYGRASGQSGRAVAALVGGFGSEVAYCDVNSAPSEAQLRSVEELQQACIDPLREWVIQELRSNGTVVEACPTSNVRLANLTGIAAHPLWNWRAATLNVIVGSDDPVVFGSTISDEFAELVKEAGEAIVSEIAAATVAHTSRNRRRALGEFREVSQLARAPSGAAALDT